MDFYQFIERLQNKSEKQKKRLLVVVVGIFVILLLIIWFVDVKKQLAGQPSLFSLDLTEGKIEKTGEKPNVRGPLASLGRGVSILISDIREKSKELLSQTSEIVAEQPAEGEKGERPVYKLPIVN